MKFPVLAIEPKGFTWLFRSEAATKRMPIGFIGIYRRKSDALEFFDSEGAVWKLESIAIGQPIPFWWRVLPTLREADVSMRFEFVGDQGLDRMKAILRRAVESDDDILTQFEPRSKILARLDAAESIDEVFRLYRWMRKDFRRNAEQGAPDQRP